MHSQQLEIAKRNHLRWVFWLMLASLSLPVAAVNEVSWELCRSREPGDGVHSNCSGQQPACDSRRDKKMQGWGWLSLTVRVRQDLPRWGDYSSSMMFLPWLGLLFRDLNIFFAGRPNCKFIMLIISIRVMMTNDGDQSDIQPFVYFLLYWQRWPPRISAMIDGVRECWGGKPAGFLMRAGGYMLSAPQHICQVNHRSLRMTVPEACRGVCLCERDETKESQ